MPRNAPIVLYGNEEVMDAVNDVRDEGFNFVSLVKGGYDGWVKSGGEIEKGPIFKTEIRWVRKLGKGEVSVADFRKAVLGEVDDVVVVDARTKDGDRRTGHLHQHHQHPAGRDPGAVERTAQGQEDLRPLLHRGAGRHGHNELVKHGYDTKFLLLNIKDAECDCPIVRP